MPSLTTCSSAIHHRKKKKGAKTGMLQGRHILVGVCGGIASYKAVDLVSKLQQAGALVDVILTEHAKEFVQPLTFATMSHRPVYSDLWEPSGEAAETHIKLAEQAELLVIVPATADTIAKLAIGMTDNMLTTVALATNAPILLAPAMYHAMYTHPATQENLARLRSRGVVVVDPEVGRLASGAVGPGRLPDTNVLLDAITMTLGRKGDLAGYQVLVTAGGTHEPIDPVRYIGNRSSGKMGYILAKEARDRGAHVILISGPVALAPPYGIEFHQVETALQMRDAVYTAIHEADVLVMSAAVADFRPDSVAEQKIKKHHGAVGEKAKREELSLHLISNPDILGELAQIQKRSPEHESVRAQRLIRVGFAAETENLATNAREKLSHKGLDLLVANDVARSDSGFGSDTNKVLIFHANGAMEDLPVMPKTGVATAIWNRIVPLLSTQ
jgi:phosphopantothenoylcysteine decarboxylase/phosphopantothenate--cysteine ligase